MRSPDADEALKNDVRILRAKITRARNKLCKLEAVDFLSDIQTAKIEEANEEVERLTGELEEAKDRRRKNASTSKGGTWHLIECGVDHLEQTVEEGIAEGSSLPGDGIEFAIITFLERRTDRRQV